MHRKVTNTLKAGAIARGGKSALSTAYAPRTKLGRRLWRIRQQIVATEYPLLDWEGLETELRARRGEAGEEA
jgi:hypothetical protein